MSCQSCAAPIRWVTVHRRSGGSRRMPLDPSPTVAGNIKVDGFGDAEVLTGLFLEAARSDGTPLFTTHFATCPNAHRHRTPR